MYTNLILQRGDYKNFYNTFLNFQNICLLCSEPLATHCHRRLAAEIIAQTNSNITIRHI